MRQSDTPVAHAILTCRSKDAKPLDLIFLWRYLEFNQRKDLWFLSFFLGIACAAKYNALVLGPLFLMILWARKGGLFFLKFTRQWLLYKNAYNKLSAFVDKITYNKPFLALLFMKFLYGTRFLIIIYIAMRQVKLKTFLFYDIIGTIIWLLVIIPIGWLAGKGAYNIIPIYKNIGYSIFILILSFVIFKLISRWLKNKITDAK